MLTRLEIGRTLPIGAPGPRPSQGRSGGAAGAGPGIGPSRSRRRRQLDLSGSARCKGSRAGRSTSCIGLIDQRHGRPDAAATAWRKAIEAADVSPSQLEELARYCVQGRHFDEAILATERLSRQPGWESRGVIMLGTIRLELNNVPEAARLFRRALDLDPAVIDTSHDPTPLRKVVARTFLRMGRPDDARPLLQSILDQRAGPRGRLAAEPRRTPEGARRRRRWPR